MMNLTEKPNSRKPVDSCCVPLKTADFGHILLLLSEPITANCAEVI